MKVTYSNKDNPLAFQPGDIVDIVEDDHKLNILSSDYQIINVPGASSEKFSYLRDNLTDDDGNIIRKRSQYLDLAKTKNLQSANLVSDITSVVVSLDAQVQI